MYCRLANFELDLPPLEVSGNVPRDFCGADQISVRKPATKQMIQ